MNTNGAVSVRGLTPKYRTLLISLLIIAAMAPCVSAVTYANPNYTPIFDLQNGADEVHVNQTYTLNTSNATPFILWLLAGLLGLGLFLLSLRARQVSGDVEVDAIISVLAWVPIAFCAYSSFAVDMLQGYGVTGLVESESPQGLINTHEFVYLENHVIYTFDVIGVLMAIFLLVAIINTIRIISLHGRLKFNEENERYRGDNESS